MEWAAFFSALGPPASRARIFQHARSYAAREDTGVGDRMAQVLSRLENQARTNACPGASLAVSPLAIASVADVGRELTKDSTTGCDVPTPRATGQSRKRQLSSVLTNSNTVGYDGEPDELRTGNKKPDVPRDEVQAAAPNNNEAAGTEGHLEPHQPQTRLLPSEEPAADKPAVPENAFRARMRYRARRTAAIAVRYAGLLHSGTRPSNNLVDANGSGFLPSSVHRSCAQLTAGAPVDAAERTEPSPEGSRPSGNPAAAARAEKHPNQTPSGSATPDATVSPVDPATQISPDQAASNLGRTLNKVPVEELQLVSDNIDVGHAAGPSGDTTSSRREAVPAEAAARLDTRGTALAATEIVPKARATTSLGVGEAMAGEGSAVLASNVEAEGNAAGATGAVGGHANPMNPVALAVPFAAGGSDRSSLQKVKPQGPSPLPPAPPSTRPCSRQATSRAGKAYERYQHAAASDPDPDSRLAAVVRCKMLASRRLLATMRGQVLAMIHTEVVPPACSVPPGGPRGPTGDLGMAGLHAVAVRKERAVWMAVVKDCVTAAAAATRIRARASSAASSSGLKAAPRSLAPELLAGVAAWHSEALAEAKRRREEAARHRIELLKSSDMQSYLALVRAEKSSRLCEMLQQTDECLRSFARRLGLDKVVGGQEGNGADASAAGGSTSTSTDAVLESSEGWGRLATRLAADIPQQPTGLVAQLREYQMHGLRWMAGLHDAGLNGILADDMGLGKTVQVIALIVYLVEVRKQPGPFLIAAPSSVLPNWASELARWAPGLKVVDYRGSAETREHIWFTKLSGGRHRSGSGSGAASSGFHVLLTSYEFLMGRHDRPRLARLRYSHIIVDEGHRLKNAGCKLNSELAHYRATSRLLLTGTPLQNRLDELWSLLNFLMPSLFNNGDDFAAWFSAPLDALRGSGGCGSSEGDVAALSQEEYLLVTSRLHQVLRPFMLRRLKESVAGELPAKHEVVLTATLSPYQAALMGVVKNGFERASGAGGGGSTAVNRAVNNTVMEMRNICNHPFISKLHPDSIEATLAPAAQRHAGLPPLVTLCGKLDLLDRLLVRLAAGRHKVLLFATMTRALDVIEEYLEWRGWESARLDGSTAAAERGALIADFNAPDSPTFVFLLSLKAGGVGLNLQAADTVILYDTDWNPQLDLQAQARAHRIGQTREVRVFRLLTADSIEQHIAGVAEEKRKFADSSITGGFFDGKTSAEERREYLLKLLATTNTGGSGSSAGPGGSEGGGEAGLLSDVELNRLVARGAEELALLEAEDERRRRAAQKMAAATSTAGAGTAADDSLAEDAGAGASRRYNRLLPGDLCDTLVVQVMEANRPKDPDEGKIFGRGMRRVNAESASGGAGPKTGSTNSGGAGRKCNATAGDAASGFNSDASKRREEKSRSKTPTDRPGFRPPAKVPPAPPLPPPAGGGAAAERTRGTRRRQGDNGALQPQGAVERQDAGKKGGSQSDGKKGGSQSEGTRRATRSSGSLRDSQVDQDSGRLASSVPADEAQPGPREGAAAVNAETESCPAGLPAVVGTELAAEKAPTVEPPPVVSSQQPAATDLAIPVAEEASLISQDKQNAADAATSVQGVEAADQVSLLDRVAAVAATALAADAMAAVEERADGSQMTPGRNHDRAEEPAQQEAGAVKAAVSLVSPLTLLANVALDALPAAGGSEAEAAAVVPGPPLQEEAQASQEEPASQPGLLGTQLQVSGPRGGKALRGVITKTDPTRPKFKYYMLYDKDTAASYGNTGEWDCLDSERTTWLAHGYMREHGDGGGNGGTGSQGAVAPLPHITKHATPTDVETSKAPEALAPGEEKDELPSNVACEVQADANVESTLEAGTRMPAVLDAEAATQQPGDGLLQDVEDAAPDGHQPQPAAFGNQEGSEVLADPAGVTVQEDVVPVLGSERQPHPQPHPQPQPRPQPQPQPQPQCPQPAETQPGAPEGTDKAVEPVAGGTGAAVGDSGGEGGRNIEAEDAFENRSARPKRSRGAAMPQIELDDEQPDHKCARVEALESADGKAFVGLKARVSWGAEGTFRGTITRYDPKRSRFGLMWLMSYTDGDDEWGAVTEDGNGWRVHRGLRPVTWIGRRPPPPPSRPSDPTVAGGPGPPTAAVAPAAARAVPPSGPDAGDPDVKDAPDAGGSQPSKPNVESTPPSAPLYRVLGAVQGRVVLQYTAAGEAALAAQRALAGGSAAGGSVANSATGKQLAAPDDSAAKEGPLSQEAPNAAVAVTGVHNGQAAVQASLFQRATVVAAIAHALRERQAGTLQAAQTTAVIDEALPTPGCIPHKDLKTAVEAHGKEECGDRATAPLEGGAGSVPPATQAPVAGLGEGGHGDEILDRGQVCRGAAIAAAGGVSAAEAPQTVPGLRNAVGADGRDSLADRGGGSLYPTAEHARPGAPLYRVLGIVQGQLVLQCMAAGQAALAAQTALTENAVQAQRASTVDSNTVTRLAAPDNSAAKEGPLSQEAPSAGVAANVAHNGQAADKVCQPDIVLSVTESASLGNKVAVNARPGAADIAAVPAATVDAVPFPERLSRTRLPPTLVAHGTGVPEVSGIQGARLDAHGDRAGEQAQQEGRASNAAVSLVSPLTLLANVALEAAAGASAAAAVVPGPPSQEEAQASQEEPASQPGLLGTQLQVSGPRGGKALRGVITKTDPARPKFKYYMLYDKAEADAQDGPQRSKRSRGISTSQAEVADAQGQAGADVEGTEEQPDHKCARVEALESADGKAFVGLKARVSWGAEGTFRGTITRYDPKRSRFGLMWLMSYTDGDDEWGAVTEDGNGWRVHRGLRPVTWIGRRPPPRPSRPSDPTVAGGPGPPTAAVAPAAAQSGTAGPYDFDVNANVRSSCGKDYRYLTRRNGMCRAQIAHKGSVFCSPYYDTPEAAAAAADYYNYKLRGTSAHLNLGLTSEQRLVLDQLTLEQLQAYIKGRGDVHDLAQALLQHTSQ